MFALIGFVAFALATLYLEQDVLQPVHKRVDEWLARRGWFVEPPNLPGPRPRRRFFRLLWQLQDCPYCISTWVAFFAVWYALSVHPWHRVFWLAWWSSVGVAWLVIAVYKMANEFVKELGARDEERQQDAQLDS